MPKFIELLKETGVDAQHNFMAVPTRGSNLVGLHDAKHFDLRFDKSKVEVLTVNRKQIHRVSHTLFQQFFAWNVVNDDSAKSLMFAMHRLLSFGLHTRLLLVTGKVHGLTAINVVHGRTTFTLDVAVVTHRIFTIAFKFLQHLDKSGNMKPRTRYNPSDARWLINKLNWIYGPQANISFEMLEAEWVRVEKVLPESLSYDSFLSNVVERKNKSADLNIFFVGSPWKGGEAGGTWFPKESTVVVEDNLSTLPVTVHADPFLVNIAHEVAHFLGAHHNDRDNVLMSMGRQSTKLDKQLVFDINPP
jgi:hypothetical protein